MQKETRGRAGGGKELGRILRRDLESLRGICAKGDREGSSRRKGVREDFIKGFRGLGRNLCKRRQGASWRRKGVRVEGREVVEAERSQGGFDEGI